MAVLNLGRGNVTVGHFFDCHMEGGTPKNLVWSRANSFQRFPTMTTNLVVDGLVLPTLRLNMSSRNGAVRHTDVGIYACTNTLTGESVSVNITAGMYYGREKRSSFPL